MQSSSFSALFYFAVFACVGLPVWWKSTAIYQAGLPCDAIASLDPLGHIALPFDVDIVLYSRLTRREDLLVGRRGDLLRPFLPPGLNGTLRFAWTTTLREATATEEKAFALTGTGDAAAHELEAALDSRVGIGRLHVHLLPAAQRAVVLGKSRNLFVFGPHNSDDTSTLLQRTAEALASHVSGFSLVTELVQLEQAAQKQGDEKARHASRRDAPASDQHALRRVFPTSAKYEVLASVAVGAGLQFSRSPKELLEPLELFLQQLEPISSFSVSTQVIYHALLNVQPEYSVALKAHTIRRQQLQHFINTFDWNFGTTIHNNPIINLVVYVPPVDLSPLLILDDAEVPLASSAFLIPRWGGVQIVNAALQNASAVALSAAQKATVGSTFVSQLRLLLGLAPLHDGSLLSASEYDYVLRNRLVENVLSASHALRSLCELVGAIRNMAISDNLARTVAGAVRALEMTRTSLEDERDWEAAYRHSLAAFVKSESAFFDKDVLALLYFPEENKYAVYIPLFLPVCLPVVVGFLRLLVRRKSKTE